MRLLLLLIFIGSVNINFAQTADELYENANSSFENEDYKGALKTIEKAIELDSLDADFYNLKALSLFKLEKFQESYNTYNKALSIFPERPYLYISRGNLFLTIQKYDYATLDFTKAMGLAKNDTIKYSAVTNRAAAKLSVRDFEGAYEDLMTAYEYDSTDVATLTNLGAVCDEVGRKDETLKYLLKVIEVDSSFYPAYGNIGFKYQEMGQYEKAIEYFNKVLEFNPKEPLGYSNRSYNRLKLGDLKGAMDDIEKSIKLYPENSYAYRIRALIYFEKGKTSKACSDLQEALDRGFTLTYGKEVLNLQREHCEK